MRRMLRVFMLVMFWAPFANAAVVTSSFTQIAGSSWSVDLTVRNDGTLAEITGLTVFFDETQYANLVLDASPATWDSIVIDPDLALASPGFFDSFVLDPAMALASGQERDGFRVLFTLLTGDAPSPLAYDIVNSSFDVLESGITRAPATGTPVPEPSTLALFGLAVLIGARTRASRAPKT